MTPTDPYLGLVFEELDSRMHGRRVRAVRLHENQRQTVIQQQHKPKLGGEPRHFVVETLDQRNHPVGRLTRVSVHSLDTRFRRVEK